MRNLIRNFSIFCVMMFCGIQSVVAAENLSIRIEEPKSPTNKSTLDVTFVVLDIVGGRNIFVTCEGGKTKASLAPVGLVKKIDPNGNTGICSYDLSSLSNNEKYYVRAKATAESDSSMSPKDSEDPIYVIYSNEYPGDPRDYGKTKTNPCLYKIHFKTADDSGKTSKVEVYRSSETSFTADSGSRVATITIGSNTEYDYVDSIPDCNKTYYYGVRAFTTAGNGSGIVGDSETRITIKTTTTQSITTGSSGTTGTGAIAISPEGSILGKATESTAGGSILGEASGAGAVKGEETGKQKTSSAGTVIRFILGGLLVAFGAWLLWTKTRKQNDSSVQ